MRSCAHEVPIFMENSKKNAGKKIKAQLFKASLV